MTQLNAVLFYPLILEDRLELVVVAPNTQPIRRTVEGVGQQQLNQVIAEFRQALDSPTGDALPPAQQLYRWLIEPLEADLAAAGIETIIYAPDGALRYIPLAALHDGDQWLIGFAVSIGNDLSRFPATTGAGCVGIQRRACVA